MMTRKHFQAIADALKVLRPIVREGDGAGHCPLETGRAQQWETVVIGLADMCSRENPRFDRGRFYMACDLLDQ